jgi:hypothetical protein
MMRKLSQEQSSVDSPEDQLEGGKKVRLSPIRAESIFPATHAPMPMTLPRLTTVSQNTGISPHRSQVFLPAKSGAGVKVTTARRRPGTRHTGARLLRRKEARASVTCPASCSLRNHLSCWILLLGSLAIRQALNRSIVPVCSSVTTSSGMTRGCLSQSESSTDMKLRSEAFGLEWPKIRRISILTFSR